MDFNAVIELVHRTADIILDPERVGHVSEKGRADYVTEADRGVQNFLARELALLTPEAGLYAEEQINEPPDPCRPCWILDPVDGTTNLIHDYQLSAVSLGWYQNGKITFGVVYNPFTDETYTAEYGRGAFLNGRQLHVSGCDSYRNSLISFGATPYRKEMARILFPVYQRIYEQIADFRRGGSAALELCHVAAGRLDAYFEGDLKPWDYAAGQLIAKEAGAVCTTFSGDPLPVFERADIIACTPGIFDVLQADLKDLRIAPRMQGAAPFQNL